MSNEIARGQSVMLALGSKCAEDRLALLLLNLADRYRRRGYSLLDPVALKRITVPRD